MARNNNYRLLPFTVTGTGSAVVEHDFFANSLITRPSGRVRRVVVREAAGGGATAADIYFATFGNKNISSPSTEPGEKFIITISAVTLTASATATSLDSPITAEPAFQDSLTAVFDVTGSGAWTITGWIEVEF